MVMPGIDKIGAYFKRRHALASALEARHQSQSNGGFTAAAVGSGYDDAFNASLLKVDMFDPRRFFLAEHIRVQNLTNGLNSD